MAVRPTNLSLGPSFAQLATPLAAPKAPSLTSNPQVKLQSLGAPQSPLRLPAPIAIAAAFAPRAQPTLPPLSRLALPPSVGPSSTLATVKLPPIRAITTAFAPAAAPRFNLAAPQIPSSPPTFNFPSNRGVLVAGSPWWGGLGPAFNAVKNLWPGSKPAPPPRAPAKLSPGEAALVNSANYERGKQLEQAALGVVHNLSPGHGQSPQAQRLRRDISNAAAQAPVVRAAQQAYAATQSLGASGPDQRFINAKLTLGGTTYDVRRGPNGVVVTKDAQRFTLPKGATNADIARAVQSRNPANWARLTYGQGGERLQVLRQPGQPVSVKAPDKSGFMRTFTLPNGATNSQVITKARQMLGVQANGKAQPKSVPAQIGSAVLGKFVAAPLAVFDTTASLFNGVRGWGYQARDAFTGMTDPNPFARADAQNRFFARIDPGHLDWLAARGQQLPTFYSNETPPARPAPLTPSDAAALLVSTVVGPQAVEAAQQGHPVEAVVSGALHLLPRVGKNAPPAAPGARTALPSQHPSATAPNPVVNALNTLRGRAPQLAPAFVGPSRPTAPSSRPSNKTAPTPRPNPTMRHQSGMPSRPDPKSTLPSVDTQALPPHSSAIGKLPRHVQERSINSQPGSRFVSPNPPQELEARLRWEQRVMRSVVNQRIPKDLPRPELFTIRPSSPEAVRPMDWADRRMIATLQTGLQFARPALPLASDQMLRYLGGSGQPKLLPRHKVTQLLQGQLTDTAQWSGVKSPLVADLKRQLRAFDKDALSAPRYVVSQWHTLDGSRLQRRFGPYPWDAQRTLGYNKVQRDSFLSIGTYHGALTGKVLPRANSKDPLRVRVAMTMLDRYDWVSGKGAIGRNPLHRNFNFLIPDKFLLKPEQGRFSGVSLGADRIILSDKVMAELAAPRGGARSFVTYGVSHPMVLQFDGDNLVPAPRR